MSQVETRHISGRTERHVTVDGEIHAFAVPDDEADVNAYEYLDDGEAPDPAWDGLAEWIDKYHDVEDEDESPESTESDA